MSNKISKSVLLSNAERYFFRSRAIRMAQFIDGVVVYAPHKPFGCYWVTDTGSAQQLVSQLGYSLVYERP